MTIAASYSIVFIEYSNLIFISKVKNTVKYGILFRTNSATSFEEPSKRLGLL